MKAVKANVLGLGKKMFRNLRAIGFSTGPICESPDGAVQTLSLHDAIQSTSRFALISA